jgi:hypothetical protein
MLGAQFVERSIAADLEILWKTMPPSQALDTRRITTSFSSLKPGCHR